jgi:hypothetical protein
MLEFLYILASLFLWIGAPLTFWLVFKYYTKESLTYRLVLGSALSTIVLLIFYFLRSLLLAEILVRENIF